MPEALNPLTYVPEKLNPVRQLRVMGRFFRRQLKKPGLPPGTIVHTGDQKVHKVRVGVIDFDAEKCLELVDVEDVATVLPMRDTPTVTWINVDGLHDTALVERLGTRYGFHPLVLEDIVHVGQRPKLEEYDDYLYVVLYQLEWQGEQAMVIEEQVSLILGPSYAFSFQERPRDDFDPRRERLRAARGKTRHHASAAPDQARAVGGAARHLASARRAGGTPAHRLGADQGRGARSTSGTCMIMPCRSRKRWRRSGTWWAG